MTTVSLVNIILSLGVIVSQISIFLALAYFAVYRKQQTRITAFFGKYGMLLAFIVALISVCSSLFYSEIAGFPPCDLCWFQRIFMYPEVILLGLALIKKDFGIVRYALSLCGIGFLISLYHNYIYYGNQGLNAYCQLSGMQISCIKRYVFEFGYITIPMMALTAFTLIIIFLVLHSIGQKNVGTLNS